MYIKDDPHLLDKFSVKMAKFDAKLQKKFDQ